MTCLNQKPDDNENASAEEEEEEKKIAHQPESNPLFEFDASRNHIAYFSPIFHGADTLTPSTASA